MFVKVDDRIKFGFWIQHFGFEAPNSKRCRTYLVPKTKLCWQRFDL